MSSKYIDSAAIIQVIGNVYNNPSLLDMSDKYVITEQDFPNEFHRIVFGSLYKLYELGIKEFSLESINDFLSTRPKSEAVYKNNKGDEWLLKTADSASSTSFDYYYKRLKKFTLLRTYDNFGIDVSDIYDIDNILDIKKKQLQEELLDNRSLEEIADLVDEKIEAIRLQCVGNDGEVAYQAGEGIVELLDRFKKYPEAGIPMYGPLINTVTRGARLGRFYLRSAPTGCGKAIPNNIIIPTLNGRKKVGDIKPGDYLFGQDGKPTKVLQIHPQPKKKEIWNVTFSDGRVAQCCKDHLWKYRYESHKGFAYRTESIEELYKRTLTLKNGLKDSTNKGYRFHIPLNEAVEYPEKQYSLPPYVMGAFLGDGSFCYNNTNKSLSFSSQDEEIPNLIIQELGEKEYYYSKYSQFNYNYYFKKVTNPDRPIWVEEFLENYSGLWNIKSENKFIPRDYLEGSIEQRYALLQGLMDADGYIDALKGRTSFTTVSPQLRDDIIELCRSLGFVTNYTIDQRTEKYTTGECYCIHIQCKKVLKPKLFRLQRKVDRAIAYANSNKREEHKDHLAIVNIQRTQEQVDMTCFTVDNKEHLFLMNDFIVTHNTRSMVADACYFACERIYDSQFGWIRSGPGQPTLYISTEQDLEEIQTMMLAFISNVNEDHIIYNEYEDGEEERVREAAQMLAEAPLYVETMPDFSLQDVENTIKKNLRDHKVRYICHDYLHSSLKILEEITRRSGGLKLREDNVLFMLSTKLKDICVKYGVFIISATQLSGDYTNAEAPDQNLLRGAKSIADKVDYGCILLPVRSDDLVKLEPILNSKIFEEPVIKISVYKNRRGRYKGIYLWCKANLGTCRIQPMFATTYGYELIEMDDIRITVEDNEPSAF